MARGRRCRKILKVKGGYRVKYGGFTKKYKTKAGARRKLRKIEAAAHIARAKKK